MKYTKAIPLATLTLLMAIATSPSPSLKLSLLAPAVAQTAAPASFPLPTAVPPGTTVRVDGSSSMTVINETLKRRFEERYPETQVNLEAEGTDQALNDLLNGNLDLVAVGRPLTDEEKAKGLVEVPINREKIAVIVGPNSAFTGELTFDQFARIFRGEITNWSEVGGPNAPIRFVDRPDISDTRNALRNYTVFKAGPFQTGATATQVDQDQTATIINQLGTDGISYAIASQVLNQPNVRVVAMHQTLPDDPRYPFSQPRGYVYTGEPNPQVRAFLGFATSAPGQEAVEAARNAETAAITGAVSPAPVSPAPVVVSPAPVAMPSPDVVAATVAEPTRSRLLAPILSPWWLLAPLGLLGLAAFLKKDRDREPAIPLAATAAPVRTPIVNPTTTAAAAAAAALAGTTAVGAAAIAAKPHPKTKLLLAPRDSDDAYAYWEAPQEHKAEVRSEGGRDLKLRVYDVTGKPASAPLPTVYQQYDVSEADYDRHIAVTPNHDYVAEVGYETADHRWLVLDQSNRISIPSTPVAPGAGVNGGAAIATGAAAIGAAAAAAAAARPAVTTTPETYSLVIPADARVFDIKDRNIYEIRDKKDFVGTLWGQKLLPAITNTAGRPINVRIAAIDGNWSYGPKDGANRFHVKVDANGNRAMAGKERQDDDLLFSHIPTVLPAALVAFKVKETPEFQYQYVAHGDQLTQTAIRLEPGESLYFISNDEPGFYHDNQEALTVRWYATAATPV